MKVLNIVGARPQFIKAFPISRILRSEHDEILLHTGQHYDEEMTDIFFDELGIPEPEVNLGVGSLSHGDQTARIMSGIESVVEETSPDVVLVYGDTNSTLAGAIVAAKMDPMLAHVESGMRSFNRDMPEEINRVLTDHAADILFTASETAVELLEAEGISEGVLQTGDVMYDTLLWAKERSESKSEILHELGVSLNEYYLATVHRPRNTDDRSRLSSILEAFEQVSGPIVFPAHPRTVERLDAFGLTERARHATILIDPVGYLDIVRLLDGAISVITDSGGLQKEAYFLETPCITLREDTEWIETVETGWNLLTGANPDQIVSGLTREPPKSAPKPVYGDGQAAESIVRALESRVN